MFPIVLGGLAGFAWILVTSKIPVVNLLNLFFGAWFFFGGMLAAYVRTQKDSGRASVLGGVLAGILAGVLMSIWTIGSAVSRIHAEKTRIAETLASMPTIAALPEEPLSLPEYRDLAAQILAEAPMDESEKRPHEVRLEKFRQEIETMKAKDPETYKNTELILQWLHQKFLPLRSADVSPLTQTVSLFLSLIGFLLTGVSFLGGLLGGVVFGGAPSEGDEPPPGDPLG